MDKIYQVDCPHCDKFFTVTEIGKLETERKEHEKTKQKLEAERNSHLRTIAQHAQIGVDLDMLQDDCRELKYENKRLQSNNERLHQALTDTLQWVEAPLDIIRRDQPELTQSLKDLDMIE